MRSVLEPMLPVCMAHSTGEGGGVVGGETSEGVNEWKWIEMFPRGHSASVTRPLSCCSLSMNLDLAAVLREAERLFYKYCRLTITRGFNEVNI